MKQSCKKQIEKAMKGLSCPKCLRCCKLGVEELCKTKEVGIEVFLECWQKNPKECKNSLLFGELRLCECPTRYHIKREKEKGGYT